MRQITEVVYKVKLAYDDAKMDEADAQYIALEEFPDWLGADAARVVVAYVERIAGGVDADGVPNQPEVRKVTVTS